MFRVASYNIHKCKGGDGVYDPERIVLVVNALSADIVALQEVDFRLGGRPAALPLQMIAAESRLLPLRLGGTGPESLGWHGQTLLIREGLVAGELVRLPLPGLEPRGAIITELHDAEEATAGAAAASEASAAGVAVGAPMTAGAAGDSDTANPRRVARHAIAGDAPPALSPPRLRLAAVHLGLRRSDRRAQLLAVRRALDAAPPCPTVILGDFNEWTNGFGLEPLDGFTITRPGRSYPARRPVASLDRVVTSAGVTVLRAGVLDTPLSRRASDHLPVWADLRVTDGTGR